MSETALVTTEQQQSIGPILPLATPEGMTDAMKQYEALKRAVLSDADEQEITVKGKKRKFIKRSGWRRLSIAFGVSSTVLAHEITRGQDGRTVSAEFTIRATAPNGRFADGWGACSAWEERFQDERGRQKMEHDIPATAETRAENRACSNLFGYGEVSAEEMEDSPEVSKPTCPVCGKPVRPSSFAEGAWYCWKKGGGCGWQGTAPVLAETGEISPATASPASQQALQAAQEITGNSESDEILPPGQIGVPTATGSVEAQPAKRRGRPLGSKNAAKGGVAVEPRSPAAASEVGTRPQPPTGFGEEEVSVEEGWLRELRSDIRKLASRLRKYQYMEQGRELPPIDLWNKEVERTLGIYIERKFGTEVVLDDVEEAGLAEALSELKGYIAKYESAEEEVMPSDAPDDNRSGLSVTAGAPQSASPAADTTVVSLHKPIVRNPVAAQRRDPTAIDPKAALDRARALAELRNRTTALLAIREGKVNLSAQDEERLRGQADATMEKVAQNAFSKAIKDLDVEQLHLLNERAKAAAK